MTLTAKDGVSQDSSDVCSNEVFVTGSSSQAGLPDGPVVEADLRRAFDESPIAGLRELEVEQHGPSVFISGKVDSFYHKQLAQEVVRNLLPGAQVVNSAMVPE